MLPDVVSDDEYVNSDKESGGWESNESDEDEEFNESAGAKDLSDIVEEDSRDQEVEEIDEAHLLDRLRPSHACGPFVCPQPIDRLLPSSYFQGNVVFKEVSTPRI